jgi:2-succinyl-6-hydroxy-2,4-cyclohexadiene-1-carboxylate synthase
MPFFSFNGRRVFFAVRGAGIPVLLLPAAESSSAMYKPVVAEYSKRFKVILIDLPGFGKSELPNEATNNQLEYFAQACRELLDYLEIRRINLIGSGLGASVAVSFAVNFPWLVNSLIADGLDGNIGALGMAQEKLKKIDFLRIENLMKFVDSDSQPAISLPQNDFLQSVESFIRSC